MTAPAASAGEGAQLSTRGTTVQKEPNPSTTNRGAEPGPRPAVEPNTGPDAVESAVRSSYLAQRSAMVAGDAEALGEQLAAGFTLTHMTGYVQSRRQWLAHVDSGEMTYHSMKDVASTVGDVDTDEPLLTVRTHTDATIWGSRGVWPLQLEIRFVLAGDRWVAAHTVASTW